MGKVSMVDWLRPLGSLCDDGLPVAPVDAARSRMPRVCACRSEHLRE